jgi:hypothetical protein
MSQPPPREGEPHADGAAPKGDGPDPDFLIPPEYFLDGSVQVEPDPDPDPVATRSPMIEPTTIPPVKAGIGLLVTRAMAGVALVALICWGFASCDEEPFVDESGVALSETAVPAPTTVDANEVVVQLAAAERAQEVCYGWHLSADRGGTVSAGSNLGVGRTVSSGTECTRWAEIAVNVRYTPESSEEEDSVGVEVRTSGNLGSGYVDSLARLGLTDSRFLDDPADSTLRAALALPLLVAESGRAGPVPTPSATPATTEPLPEASSDFWRNNSTTIWVGIVAVVLGAWLVLYGFFVGRHQRAEDARRAAIAAARRKASARPKKNTRKARR